MHTGIISFCDRIAYNIKSSEIKDKILQDLKKYFEIIILQKHWHRLDTESVKHLQRIPHLACLRSNGNPYYMYFTKYEDVPIIYFIDKKVQSGYQVPRIILCKGTWKEDIFSNTLIEGEMVKNFDGKWLFLINDVIGFKGKYLINESLPQRIEYAFEILSTMYTPNNYMDVCEYKVKKYAYATQEGTDALIDMSKNLNYTSRGIYYCPFSYKYKPKLINFDDTLIKSVIRKVKDTPDFQEKSVGGGTPLTPLTKQENHAEIHGENQGKIQGDIERHIEGDIETQKILWLRKTENPDVYDIYSTDHGMVNNTKIGIASVHTLVTSKMLRNAFKDATVAMYIPYVCKYNKEVSKWVPLKRSVESS
uniref:mRNA capping enzyme adenylation domain-containing protein n=1 Tax=viral metagenome TaxID=1070528 RepID=A0A6C0KS40_9ZZZZ